MLFKSVFLSSLSNLLNRLTPVTVEDAVYTAINAQSLDMRSLSLSDTVSVDLCVVPGSGMKRKCTLFLFGVSTKQRVNNAGSVDKQEQQSCLLL